MEAFVLGKEPSDQKSIKNSDQETNGRFWKFLIVLYNNILISCIQRRDFSGKLLVLIIGVKFEMDVI